MQVSVEATGNLERRMTVQVPAERIEKEVESRLRSLARRAKLDGFRPGKVPFKVVQRRFGGQVRQEVLGELMKSTFYEAVRQEKLQPASGPKIEATRAAPGEALEYTAVFEIYPEIKLSSFDKLKVERPVARVTDGDVDRMIESLRKQRAIWEEVERPAREGDHLTIDYEGALEEGEFPGGKGRDVAVVLGAGSLVDGFEEQLVGAKAGEERTVQVTFPDDYRVQELAGKKATVKVKVNTVAESRLPEVDEAFARSFGVKEGGMEGLRKEVRANMERELEQAVRSRVKRQVLDALLAENPVDLPRALVDEEIDRLREQADRQLAGLGDAKPELPRERFEEDARRRVALGLLIAEIIKANDIRVDEERVRKQVETIASTYENPGEVVKWYYANRSLLEGVEAMVLEDQVVDWILERAQVEDVDTSFDALMGAGDRKAS